MSKSAPEISVVATIYMSEDTVSELVETIKQHTELVTQDFEIILVEDGGLDSSWKRIASECEKDSRVKGVKLSRNFGQQKAMSAGMRYASGKYCIIMDGDLQNPPEAIGSIYRELEEGNDIVYTVSKTRNSWREELTSKALWFLINNILGAKMVPNQLMLKGLSGRLLDSYNLFEEQVRIVAGIIHYIGLKQSTIEVENKRRTSGKGNYSFYKRFHLMLDVVLPLSVKPLEILINISLFAIFISVAMGIWCAYNYFRYPEVPPGYTTLISFVTFFGSLILFVLGILGRYMSNIYTEVRGRPLFLVDQELNTQS